MASKPATAKKTDAKKGDAPAKKNFPPERPKYKYNVDNLVADLGVLRETVRKQLRDHNIEKAEGGVYGWDNQTKYNEVLKTLKGDKKDEKKTGKKAA